MSTILVIGQFVATCLNIGQYLVLKPMFIHLSFYFISYYLKIKDVLEVTFLVELIEIAEAFSFLLFLLYVQQGLSLIFNEYILNIGQDFWDMRYIHISVSHSLSFLYLTFGKCSLKSRFCTADRNSWDLAGFSWNPT